VEGLRPWRAAVADGVLPGQNAGLDAALTALERDPDFAPEIEGFAAVITPRQLPVLQILQRVAERLEADLEWWLNAKDTRLKQRRDFRAAGVEIVGDPLQLYVHRSATLLPGVVCDTRNGPIILDREAQVSPFSYLEGPLYAGPGARLDNVRLTGGCVLGRAVRVGGEIENSIFDACSNKHHEGFVGHSVLGRWVNLGALTTTSDLKNNYGPVRLQIDDAYPLTPSAEQDASRPGAAHPDPRPLIIDTGAIKFGSLVGDCVKTAIGTLLNTGTILDAGSNVFGGSPPKYLPPLSWGPAGERYESERFAADCEKIFARRAEEPARELRELVRMCL
jgi:glucose-1-phosphate thymidylyltransferase